MAGKAKVRIEGEDATGAAWSSAVGRGRKAADQMGSYFKTAFAGISIAGIASVGAAAIKAGDDLNKAAIKAGVGGKQISELAYAAKLADVELSSLSTALRKMQVAISQASSGGKDQIATLRAIGLEISDIKDLKADQQFELIADQISKLGSEEDKTRALTEIFGKAGGDLAPLFEQGAEGIRKARIEAEKIGASFGDETIAKLAAADDSVKRLSASWEAFAIKMTSKVAPMLSRALDFYSGAPKDTSGQIADIEDQLELMKYARGPNVKDQRRSLMSQLTKLRSQNYVDSLGEMGVGQLGQTASGAPSPGYKRDTSAEDAAAAREYQKQIRLRMQDEAEFTKWLNANEEERVRFAQEEWETTTKDIEDSLESLGDDLKDLKIVDPLVEGAGIVRDAFMQAFDNLAANGKIQFDELLKYIAVAWARAGLAKLLNSAFEGAQSNGGGWASLLSAVGSAFGSGGSSIDGKASGGPVRAGKTYLVGERGMELFRPSTNGSIVPNHALGGGGVTISQNITLSGANTVTAKDVQQIVSESNRRLLEDLNRHGMLKAPT